MERKSMRGRRRAEWEAGGMHQLAVKGLGQFPDLIWIVTSTELPWLQLTRDQEQKQQMVHYGSDV